jgi:hypothetical protein
VIEAVSNAEQIRDLIMAKVRQSRTAGLGDEVHQLRSSISHWPKEHVAALKEIRDALVRLGEQLQHR